MARIHRSRRRRGVGSKGERGSKKRIDKKADGKYHIHGKTFKYLRGSRREVWNGTAFMTEGELEKSDLLQKSNGRIVSKKKHDQSKKNNNLVKAGWSLAKKGKFGAVRSTKKNRK